MKIRFSIRQIIPAIVIVLMVLALRVTFLELDTDVLDNYKDSIRYSLFVLAFIHVIYNYKKLDYKYELILFLCLVAIISVRNGSLNLLVLMCVATICMRYSYDFTVKVLVVGELAGALYYFVLLALGKVKSITYLHKGNYAQVNRMRVTMGFSNVNLAGMFFLSLGILIIMSKRGKGIFNWMAGLGIIFWGYALTRARTAYMCAILFILFCLFFYFSKGSLKKSEWLLKRVMVLLDFIIVFATLIPFASGYIYRKFPYLDAFSTGRFVLYEKYLRTFTSSTWLWGRSENAMVDCLVLVFVAKYGIIVGIWTLYLIIQAINRLYVSGNYIEASFLMAVYIADISETYLLRLSDMMVILFWILVMRNTNLNAEYGLQKNTYVKEQGLSGTEAY